MTFFKKNKKEEAEKPIEEKKEKKSAPAVSPAFSAPKSVLIRQRVTEKATEKSMNDNVYVFEVQNDATKKEILSEVKSVYNVSPTKIAISKIPSKSKFIRGKWGRTAHGKKAYVYLKKGDKIDIT